MATMLPHVLPAGHARNILLQCLLVTTPMLASSIAVLYIVYAHLIEGDCPTAELCPGSELANTTSKGYYYVDFPAARLAFVSSLSSTVSFTLVGFFMTTYAYVNAAALLHASDNADQASLPTPHQMSVLLKVLNAEMMVLYTLATSKLKRIFWNKNEEPPLRNTSHILDTSIIVLLSGLVASLLVQAADTYFHIAADSIELVQFQPFPSATRQFSRGLAPWCLDRPTIGPLGQKNFWGCGITAQAAPYNNATSLAPTNATIIQDMKNSNSDQHQILNFTNAEGVQYAVVAPANVGPSYDWKASSFGVSTTCSAIPEGACSLSDPITNAKDGQGSPIMLVPFNCTKEQAGIDITGNITSHNTKVHMLDFHKYAAESQPFLNNSIDYLGDFKTILQSINAGEDANQIFKNPWHALAMRKIPFASQGDFSQLPPSFQNDSRVWKHPLLGALILMVCNITIWDATYTSLGSQITNLTTSPSNGSTAGAASMPGTRFIGTLTNIFQDESTGPETRRSPSTFIRGFELGMSKAYSYSLASQTSGRPSLLVQARTSKVVTKLPVAALWFLVVANVAFAMLGFGLAAWAMMRATPVVHQLQMRMGFSGLVAALFDREHSEMKAKDEDHLMKKGDADTGVEPRRIEFFRTGAGGAGFGVYREEKAIQDILKEVAVSTVRL
ncbi:hypothetical protein K491DRAFT_149337 [Lophiostoma macrostomum CBS 122681]|uniref:Uncharacterized protein n=1 Tax=Lophiostoma macrostomum CBS 122681 TaxID=1314788 RepID=A0A6A6ST07_9PLEO|nr:hypothetical protein K491DRAFT_149337 [Lophiostoma macrostomum CBS 122681]